jgi:transcriptional regulator of acetoin/glycerol metabolism
MSDPTLSAPPGRRRASGPAHPGDLFETALQHRVGAAWEGVVAGRAPAAGADHAPAGVRPDIAASWARCASLTVDGALARAPRLPDPGALHEARARCDWLALVPGVVRDRQDIFLGGAYVLSVFDADGCMLHADGDPDALAGLAEINFAPGGMWSESVAGTNGPGTALATGAAVQVVGAEHWCQGWKPWHCAAAPVRDPLTGGTVGAVDLSGRVERALPHALAVVQALSVAVEERLAARVARERTRILTRWADLVSAYPEDSVLALGRGGRVVARNGAWIQVLERARARGEGVALEAAWADLVGSGGSGDRDFTHPALPGGRAAVVPVRVDARTPGLCLILPRRSSAVGGGAASQAAPGVDPVAPARERAGHGTAPRAASGGPRYTLDDLLGGSERMQDVRRVARGCARTDLPVLLVGASGTGKEVLAQGIHNAGPRRGAPFVPVNCGALPRDLVAAELFGYVEGAFSGARSGGSRGTFDTADRGTLFLDEVGDLPLDAQATLLRTLEEGAVRPVGAPRAHPVDVRVIAATNRNLTEAIARGEFRADLYHRLAVLTVTTPTLAERPEDIAGLAARFLDVENAGRSVPRHFTPAAQAALVCYAWPGNVRELLNLVKRLVALSETAEIGVEDLPAVLRDAAVPGPGGASLPGGGASGPGRARQTDPWGGPVWPAAGRPDALAPDPGPGSVDAERVALARVIGTHPTMVAAARALGVSRSTLYRRMKRLGLDPGRAARLGRR